MTQHYSTKNNISIKSDQIGFILFIRNTTKYLVLQHLEIGL